MLLLELGVWFIPFTLFVAPGRRFVILVSNLQQLFESVRRSMTETAEISRRMARLETMTFLL